MSFSCSEGWIAVLKESKWRSSGRQRMALLNLTRPKRKSSWRQCATKYWVSSTTEHLIHPPPKADCCGQCWIFSRLWHHSFKERSKPWPHVVVCSGSTFLLGHYRLGLFTSIMWGCKIWKYKIRSLLREKSVNRQHAHVRPAHWWEAFLSFFFFLIYIRTHW